MKTKRRMVVSGLLPNAAVKKDRETEFVIDPHPHLLIFYRQGKPVGKGICCSKCSELFRPPAFGCSKDDCGFNIHQSCLDLPVQILSPFHTHQLYLTTKTIFPCCCCGQKPYDASYICRHKNCLFVMDVPCVIADPKASGLLMTTAAGGGCEFRHFSHPHPLNLHLETDPERRNSMPICLLCENPITNSTYYYCSQSVCHSHAFHQQCAELSRQILIPDLHSDHPLFLFSRPWNPKTHTICLCCKDECINFFYTCTLCDFNLHLDCISSFKHKHNFHILRKKLSYKCQLCQLSETIGFPWLCTVCHQFAHEKCAMRQMSQQHHPHSSSAQISNNYDSLVNPNNNNLENGIQHFSHKEHKLTLCWPHEDMQCDGCMLGVSTPSQCYACLPCRFYLHQECATLPTQHNNSFLHPHELSIIYIPDFVFSCALCLQYCHGFAYRCEECHYAIDIRCAAIITFPFTHSSHPHPMSYYDGKADQKCKACGEELRYKKIIGCEDCKFYLDVRCAHLPLGVRNRFDEHPLILTFVNEDKNRNSTDEKESEEGVEYYCDVCEEKRNVNEWFYQCLPCCFAAHPKCVLGDYPFLKSAKFENHPHPLSLVNDCKKRYSSRSCDACGRNYCDGKLAFDCGNSICKFNVHAFGHCYHNQLTQGRITFTMASLRYRSISLHLDPDEIKWWQLISFNEVKDECSPIPIPISIPTPNPNPTLSFISQGSSGGQDWDDGVFCSIRELYIYIRWYVEGIQIKYEDKDGNSIWKDIHGCNVGTIIGVTLNHPDEYLISIHGRYDEEYGIMSLNIETNQRTLGPYGETEDDKYESIMFSFPTKRVKIVGFQGRSYDDSLSAIGFHFVQI